MVSALLHFPIHGIVGTINSNQNHPKPNKRSVRLPNIYSTWGIHEAHFFFFKSTDIYKGHFSKILYAVTLISAEGEDKAEQTRDY